MNRSRSRFLHAFLLGALTLIAFTTTITFFQLNRPANGYEREKISVLARLQQRLKLLEQSIDDYGYRNRTPLSAIEWNDINKKIRTSLGSLNKPSHSGQEATAVTDSHPLQENLREMKSDATATVHVIASFSVATSNNGCSETLKSTSASDINVRLLLSSLSCVYYATYDSIDNFSSRC